MSDYFIWTIGCQMNQAESQKVADYLELLGYQATDRPQKANLVVLNTCVVRQSAEDKVIGMLGSLKGIKNQKPDLSILVTGCFVDSNIKQLEKNFPYVDLFFKPSDFAALVRWLQGLAAVEVKEMIALPASQEAKVSAFIPIIQGCNNFCSYCIVPYRRGRDRSRPINEVVSELTELVNRGTREVILLGQNVNAYGRDLPEPHDLADLLIALNNTTGLDRIRFLTNHPKDMSEQLIQTIAHLDKVCQHINLPLQSGNDDILKSMRRGYTAEQYQQLVGSIRRYMPEVALSTDVIVGFPGESDEQFKQTLDMLEKIRFDTVHVAAYSIRPGTAAAHQYQDDIPPELKKERLNKVEEMQTGIATAINAQLTGKRAEVLVEGKKGGKWYGRTRSNKLVFFESAVNCLGLLVDVTIVKTSPWSLQARSPVLVIN
jgi:tRNA-2-methylthio-N6-dimethylallyladenosine synthase